jgi:hypothetical protein
MTSEEFSELYKQSVFKLAKYSAYYPEFLNKQLTPANILYDIEKKYFRMSYQNKLPALAKVRNKSIAEGAGLTLVVRSINYVDSRSTYFIELSDGWSSIYAVAID